MVLGRSIPSLRTMPESGTAGFALGLGICSLVNLAPMPTRFQGMILTWEAGVGLKLYLSKYVTFRFDVRDFLLPQEVLGRGRITNNVTALGGLSFWTP